MGHEQRTLQIGTVAVCLAVALRLLSGGGVQQHLTSLLQQEQIVSFLICLGTGRPVRPVPSVPQIPATQPETIPTEALPETVPTEPLPDPTPPPTVPAPLPPKLTAADAALVSIRDYTGYAPDPGEAILKETGLSVSGSGAKVLILHTHTTEAYADTPGYRSKNADENMISIGAAVAQLLQNAGVEVIHDTSIHDSPSYNGSYESARGSAQRILEENPQIQLILDLHRDAASDAGGGQLNTHATVNGENAAQLMLVVGTDAEGFSHPGWRNNFAFAVQLHATLEKMHPGLCRDLCLRSYRFNQDLSPGALLVEVGAAGDTRQEALTAARALAEGILTLLG